MRRPKLTLLLLAASTVLALAQIRHSEGTAHAFSIVEATIPQMQTAMEQKRVTSREIVLQYLTRIATYEDRLNAVITVNPKALQKPKNETVSALKAGFAGRCMAYPSRSKTTSIPPTCPRPVAPSSSMVWCLLTRPRSPEI